MKRAELIVVKSNTIARTGNESHGPFQIQTETDFKSVIQSFFNRMLKGINGHILVKFNGKLFLCERDNIDPTKPYVRNVITYHPLADQFKGSAKPELAALLGMGELATKTKKKRFTSRKVS